VSYGRIGSRFIGRAQKSLLSGRGRRRFRYEFEEMTQFQWNIWSKMPALLAPSFLFAQRKAFSFHFRAGRKSFISPAADFNIAPA